MARNVCNGCGGYIGLDCFNPQECEWIAMDMQRIQRQNEQDRLNRIENDNKILREEIEKLKREHSTSSPD